MPVQVTGVNATEGPVESKDSPSLKPHVDDTSDARKGSDEQGRLTAPSISENPSLSATLLHSFSCAMCKPEMHRPLSQLSVTFSSERELHKTRDAGDRAPLSPRTEERSLELLLFMRSSEGVDGVQGPTLSTLGANSSPFFFAEGHYDTIHVKGIDSLSVSMTCGEEKEEMLCLKNDDASTPGVLLQRGESWDDFFSQTASSNATLELSCSKLQRRKSRQKSSPRSVQNPERKLSSASVSGVFPSAFSDLFSQGSGMNMLDGDLCPNTLPAAVVSPRSSLLTEGSVVGNYETSELEVPSSEVVDKGCCCEDGAEANRGVKKKRNFSPVKHPTLEWEWNRVNTAVILGQSPYVNKSWCKILTGERAVELPSLFSSFEDGKKQRMERFEFDEVLRLCPVEDAGFPASARLSGLLHLFVSGYNTVMILGYNGSLKSTSEDFVLHSIQFALSLIERETKQTKRIASHDITLRMSAVKPSENKACDLMCAEGEFRDMVIGQSPLYGPGLLEMEDVELEMQASKCAAQIRAAFDRCAHEQRVRMIIATLRLKQLQNSSKMSVFVSSMQFIILSDPVTLIKGGSASGGASTIVQSALSGPYATLLVGCLNGEPGHREWINLISQRGSVTKPPPLHASLNNLLRETVLPNEDTKKEVGKGFGSELPYLRNEKSLKSFEGRITRRSSIAFTDLSDSIPSRSTGTMSRLPQMGGGSSEMEMSAHTSRRWDRRNKSIAHGTEVKLQQLRQRDKHSVTRDLCSTPRSRFAKRHRFPEKTAESGDGSFFLASWKQVQEQFVNVHRKLNHEDESSEGSPFTTTTTTTTTTTFDTSVLQEKPHKVRTVVVLTSALVQSNPITANAANALIVRSRRGENPVVLFTADEVLHSPAEKSLRRSWEIKQAVRLFALGYNAALICNTIHPSGSEEVFAMPEWSVLLEELEILLDRESLPTGVSHEIQFSMCIVDGQRVVRDVLRSGEDENAVSNPLALCFSPILGTGISGVTYMKLKESRYILRLRAAIHSASEYMYSCRNDDGHSLLVTRIILRQFDTSTMSGKSEVKDVVLSSLFVTSTFARMDKEVTNGDDKDSLASPASPIIDFATGHPRPLFQFCLGGPCHTVSCVSVGGDTCGSRALAALHTQRFLHTVANMSPIHGSIRQFLERSEKARQRENERLEKARKKGKDVTAIACRIERLARYLEGYRRLIGNPMAEDPVCITEEYPGNI